MSHKRDSARSVTLYNKHQHQRPDPAVSPRVGVQRRRADDGEYKTCAEWVRQDSVLRLQWLRGYDGSCMPNGHQRTSRLSMGLHAYTLYLSISTHLPGIVLAMSIISALARWSSDRFIIHNTVLVAARHLRRSLMRVTIDVRPLRP